MLKNLLKFLVAGVAIGYLIFEGKLDADKLAVLIKNPLMVVQILGLWFCLVIPAAALRFNLFLRSRGMALSFPTAFSLTMIGNFFNNTLPGVVSGDLIKGFYLNRTSPNITKREVAAVIIIDRVVGLIGLIIIGMLGLILSILTGIKLPILVMFFLLVLFGGAVVFYLLIFIDAQPLINRLLFRENIKSEGIRATLRDIIGCLHQYASSRYTLVFTLLLSCLIQLTVIFAFFLISQNFFTENLHILRQAVVIPPGMIAVALPISPAGIGVGHAGFEALYHLVGLEEGANIFNIFIILQILVNLTGVIPYLIYGKKQFQATG